MEKLAILTISSHNIAFSKMTTHLKEALKDYCRNLMSYEKVAQGRGMRPKLIIKDVYAASPIDRSEIRFHINHKNDILNYLRNKGYTEESFEVIIKEPFIAEECEFEIKDNRKPFDYQVGIIDYLVKPGRSKVITLETGGGKAQPLDSKILTPNGWTTMGEIKVGAEIITSCGSTANVTAVYPQGIKDIYRITFSDGRTAECCNDHLWYMYNPNTGWIIRPLSFIRKRFSINPTYRAYVPLPGFIDFESKDLPIKPYQLGVLLGDGHLGNVSIMLSNSDEEIITSIRKALPNSTRMRTPNGSIDHRLIRRSAKLPNEWRKKLSDLGLLGKLSYQKFIPEVYKFGNYNQRLALLQGLLDTDGYASANNSTSYSTSSKQLADDICELARSLGCWAKISTKKPFYTYKGKRHEGRLNYNIWIRSKKPTSLFRLFRKRERISDDNQYSAKLKLTVTNIEKVREAEAQCISINGGGNLYITDNYVVTHNTTVSLRAAAKIGKRLLIIILGRYVEKWIGDVEGAFHLKKNDLMVVRGSKNMISMMNHALADTLNAKIIICTSTTFQKYLKDHEQGGLIGYPIAPYELLEKLKIGTKLIDECFEDGSEILTPNGFKLFQDLTEDDLVAQYTLTGEVEFVKPNSIISRHHKGELHVIDSDRFYSSVTPGHRRVFHDSDGNIIVKEARDGLSAKHYIPRSGTKVNGKSVRKELIQLAVALQADAYRRDVNGKSYWHITLGKERKITRLISILKKLNIHYQLGAIRPGGYSRYYLGTLKGVGIETILDKTKTFNRAEILSWDRKSLEIFRRELIHWDGSIANGIIVYCTTNKDNAETACLVGHLTNLGAEITTSVDNRKETYNDYHRVYFSSRNRTGLTTNKEKIIPYDGMVHCVTVPSGMVMVRQRGRIQISGNCHQFFHLNFKMDLYSHVEKTIFLSATLEPSNGFLNKMYQILYPYNVRLQGKVKEKYIDVCAVSYRIIGAQKMRCTRNGSYSHTMVEAEIMKSKYTLVAYLEMIWKITKDSFVDIKQKGQKLLIFAATVDMCTYIRDYIAKRAEGLLVARYTSEDSWKNLHENDIVVSTLGSSGTAVDIIDLKVVLMTVSVASIQQNIQALGRARKLVNYPGDHPEYIYLYSPDIQRQKDYHMAKYDLFRDHCRSHKHFDTNFKLDFNYR